ncbi:MAG TPA: hypothetical protein DDW85_15950 [Porphyromonadaceae bacterium]|nr:hypothetical protein [Porphyromonadaceae bacterium]
MGKRKRNSSYADVISKAQVMSAGLKNNTERVAKRGIDEAFITGFDGLTSESIAANDLQEKLKADLKVQTDALEAKTDELQDKYGEAKKVVKLEFPQAQWKEFGIEDKH